MIYEISRQVADELRSRRVPLPVVYGPEQRDGTPARERIVIQRSADRAVPMRGGGGKNSTGAPKTPSIAIMQGVLVRIFARAPEANAGVQLHQRRAEHVRDRVMVAFDRIVRDRNNNLEWGRMEHVRPEDVAPEQTAPWTGAVYEVELAIDRGLADRSWPTDGSPQGEALREVVIGSDVILDTPAPPEVS